MNQKALKVLEYSKIKALWAEQAVSAMCKEKIMGMEPYLDAFVIRDELRSTTEGVDLIVNKGPLPIYGIYDIEKSVNMATKGGTLSMKNLIYISYNLKTCGRVKTFLKGELPSVQGIVAMASLLDPLESISGEIDRCILSEDEMADNASSELGRIRRDIVRTGEDIKTKLAKMATSEANRPILREGIVTMRDGRYVLPVKSEHAYKVPGMIHDRSKGGKTLFVEPQIIVNLNNRLRQLKMDEEAEISRILEELSSKVSGFSGIISNNQRILVDMDYIMSKSKLSLAMEGNEPELIDRFGDRGYVTGNSTVGEISIVKGRHPLLNKTTVVPTTVSVGKDYRTLIITGPNTGGKTVTLKTVGLFALMVQSGLHIPAESTSRFPVFHDIFADIGDEQSIEQSLSTFSSHMKNIVEIVNKAGDKSLVLLDELGAGTDPTEGAALAISIIETLRRTGALVMATTHYSEIKKYAIATDGVENASMEFDIDTLSPTYRLTVGIPGKSKAFEISRKLGLPNEVIKKAEELVNTDDIKFEDLLGSLEESRKKAEDERDEAIMINIAMKKKQAQIDETFAKVEERRAKILADAKSEAREIIRSARKTSKEVQKQLNKLNADQSLGERNKIIQEGRRRLGVAEKALQTPLVRKVNADPVSSDELREGMRVKLLTMDQNGTVIGLPDNKGDILVQIGAIKVKAKLSDIAIVVDGSEPKAKIREKFRGSRTKSSIYRSKAMTVTPKVDVRGMNLEEAVMKAEKHIDDAYIAGLDKTTIVHGRGEGILREGIRQMLRRNKHVESFEKPPYNEGGEGATIVILRRM
ncbi:MAG: endonuclease MutS2 [Clostridiales bacterium]|nr:endonuclease MutS2 [Clostridiales bacterium]MDY4060394.1 endonuclease MutS2 [Anaerovoracaceae bacterium]